MKFSFVLVISLVSLSSFGAIDLNPSDLVRPPNKYVFRQDSEGRKFILTGISVFNNQGHSNYLAVSPVNPIGAKATKANKQAFGSLSRHPMSWKEADSACKSYKAGGKDWHLPSVRELSLINANLNFLETFLQASKGEEADFSSSYASTAPQLPEQFTFFWSSERNMELDEGLRLAAYFGKDARVQSMSMARPLSLLCTTTFSGPMAE